MKQSCQENHDSGDSWDFYINILTTQVTKLSLWISQLLLHYVYNYYINNKSSMGWMIHGFYGLIMPIARWFNQKKLSKLIWNLDDRRVTHCTACNGAGMTSVKGIWSELSNNRILINLPIANCKESITALTNKRLEWSVPYHYGQLMLPDSQLHNLLGLFYKLHTCRHLWHYTRF